MLALAPFVGISVAEKLVGVYVGASVGGADVGTNKGLMDLYASFLPKQFTTLTNLILFEANVSLSHWNKVGIATYVE